MRLRNVALLLAILAPQLAGCGANSAGSNGMPAANAAPASPVKASARAMMLRPGAPLPSWMRLAHGAHGDAYVSQFDLTVVGEYRLPEKKNAPPACKISDQPYVNGLGVDASLNVWIPQGGIMTGTTTEFSPHCGKALLSIGDSDGQPAAVTFDRKGNVYVENITGTSSDFAGNIDVYAPGTTTPSRVLRDPASFEWFDEAIDAHGNLFAVYNDFYNKGHVIEFAHARGSYKDLPMTLGFPGGITFDSSGNLLVVDQDAVNVSVYAPPFTGSPIATFRLQADSIPCKFNYTRKQLYCADFTNASVDVYAYDAKNPGATKYAYSFNSGIERGSQNAGIALSPPAPL